MIFGNSERFAIEAHTETHLKPPSGVWGRMCVWCAGEMLGDIDDPHCGLEASSSFKELADDLDSLWDDTLSCTSPLEMFDLLDRALYLDSERSLESIKADAARYSKFNFLTNWGEQFDGFKAFVVAQPNAGLLILFRRRDNSFGFVDIERQEFIEAARSVSDWFENETERLLLTKA